MKNLTIRHAVKEDCEPLLELMKKLAVFEDYIDDFAVTKQDLISHGFSNEQTKFTAIVAEEAEQGDAQNTELLGYLVYYLIPFTFDLNPTLFIKELYVNKSARGNNIGKKLMQATIKDAKDKGCRRMKWDVLSDNIKAQSFYKSFGAKYDKRWQGFVLNV
jgi:ribosomal protein S18 acetylase RimI-like enzyme